MFTPNRREAQKKMQETEINQNPITRVGTRDLHSNFSSTFVIRENKEAGRKCSHGRGAPSAGVGIFRTVMLGRKAELNPWEHSRGQQFCAGNCFIRREKTKGEAFPT